MLRGLQHCSSSKGARGRKLGLCRRRRVLGLRSLSEGHWVDFLILSISSYPSPVWYFPSLPSSYFLHLLLMEIIHIIQRPGYVGEMEQWHPLWITKVKSS